MMNDKPGGVALDEVGDQDGREGRFCRVDTYRPAEPPPECCELLLYAASERPLPQMTGGSSHRNGPFCGLTG